MPLLYLMDGSNVLLVPAQFAGAFKSIPVTTAVTGHHKGAGVIELPSDLRSIQTT
jgi:hypothetical protein